MNLDRIISIAKSKAKLSIRFEFDWRARTGRFPDEYVFLYPGVAQYIDHLWRFYITHVSRESEKTLDYAPFDTRDYGQRTYYLEKVRGGYIVYSKWIDPVHINRLPANIDEVISVFEQAIQFAEHDVDEVIAEAKVRNSADKIACTAVMSQVDDLLKEHDLKLSVEAHPSGKLKCRMDVNRFSLQFPVYYYTDIQSVREETRKVIEANMDNIYSPEEDY